MKNDKPVELLFIERNPQNLKQFIKAFKNSKLPNHIRFTGNPDEALRMIFQIDEFRDFEKPDIIISDIQTYRQEVRGKILNIIARREAIKCIPTVILSSLEEVEKLEIQNCPNLLIPKPKTLEEHQNVVESIEKFWLSVHKE
jgi:CheY-like chemotaxis protein